MAADSNRFGAAAKSASLAVVDVSHALARHPALVGSVPAGQFPRGLAVAPGSSMLLVANDDSGQLETVNLTALP